MHNDSRTLTKEAQARQTRDASVLVREIELGAPPPVRVGLWPEGRRAALSISGATVRNAYSASDPNLLRLGPNNAVMWEAISWAGEQGYARFAMGRTAHDNPSLASFKHSWGAQEEPMPYYYHPAIAGLASTSAPGRKYRLLTGGWRRLPLPISQALGGVLYKHHG